MRPRTTSEAVLANQSGRLPAPAMPGAAPSALWARLRLHIHGLVVLRLPALQSSTDFLLSDPTQEVPEGSGVICGVSGQSGERQLGGLGVRYPP